MRGYNRSMRSVLIAALCLSFLLAVLPAQEKPKAALDKAQLETFVRHLLAVIPEVQVKIDDPKQSAVPDLLQVDVHFSYNGRSQDETFFVTKDGKDLLRGTVYDVAQNPFKPELDKLKTADAPMMGTPGAPVTLVIFSDFECPNCKQEDETLRQNLLASFPKQVRLYFKDFPLEQIHPWAKAAAMAGRCIYHQNPAKFWEYHDWIYSKQNDLTVENLKDQILAFANNAKDLDTLQLGRCMETKATEAEVNTSLAEGHALKVDATPTIFVNGRRLVGNYPWSNIEQIINGELNYQKAAQSADEKCCEIKIPSPLNK
jgi:protein-disulfide isomerase